ncbi:hypothetical protein [Paracoccus sp. (in: a-proteobacteria)]|uniref:hypothetical protein n=1 Tax=Paracoccus sp. TaxID=267 RepID=UPI002AFE11A5|nr:hypothetical protein [Paracoccus sp. (in: a-proteobacteria)]
MAKPDDQSAVASRDLDALVEQTQTAALRLLDQSALEALQRDLRAMKESEQDDAVRKALGLALRRAGAERRHRKAQGEQVPEAAATPAPFAELAAEPAPVPAGKAKPLHSLGRKPDKTERKRIKEAEKAEKKRVKEAEKAERKAAKQAARDAAKAERKAARTAQADPKPAKTAGKDKAGKGRKAD